jgi:site-specific recombinase XerD
MLEELQRRNYAEASTRGYLHTVEDFSRRFHLPPDRLGPRHIREYQAELFQKRKSSPATVAQRLAALRFFYTKTLRKVWSVAETPYHPFNPHSGPRPPQPRAAPFKRLYRTRAEHLAQFHFFAKTRAR